MLKNIFLRLDSYSNINPALSLVDFVDELNLADFSLGEQYDAFECLLQLLSKYFPLCDTSLFRILRSCEILCDNCRNESSNSTVDFDIKIDVSDNSSGPISIFEAIQRVQLPTLVDYVCEKCKSPGPCFKADYIQSTGSIMVVYLKLFNQNYSGSFEKVHPALIIEDTLDFGGSLGSWSLSSIIYHL